MVSKTSSRVLFSGSMLDFGGVNHWDLYLFFWALFAKTKAPEDSDQGRIIPSTGASTGGP